MDIDTIKLTKYDWFSAILIAAVVSIVSIPRFGFTYPDSEYYLQMVQFFQGTYLGADLTAPFCYRPMLPLIAALIPIEPIISFGVLNLIFVILLSWTIFFIGKEFGSSWSVALFASLVCVLSLPVLFYGAVTLVDPGAMFFLGLSYYMLLTEKSSPKISGVLVFGILFKEVAALGILTFLLFKRFRGWYWMIPPAGVYLFLRMIIPSSNPDYIWEFHFNNILQFSDATARTFLFGLTPILLFFIFGIIVFLKRGADTKRISSWMISTGIPSIGYLFLGLFFAHFDVRFLWPMYLTFLPGVILGIEFILRPLESYIKKE